ncbi:ferritin subunit [Aethina tumida]|uniref:ferritin subunit n=1 Tax=Aethina tumida TaxID=116153 RepID=UPI00096AF193|nr:ferritin subunit [Aethina tumida]
MKPVVLVVLTLAVFTTAEQLHCKPKSANIPTDWLDMVDPCVKKMKSQIQEELKASLQYLAMGAYFSKDTVNRPGFAKSFFESASEEREHAIKLISYLLMRGGLTKDVRSLIRKNVPVTKTSWSNGVEALKDALILEASVTKKIRDVIKVCESPNGNNFNDYHLVDYLTGDFLEEQYKGQKEIATKISILDKLMDQHGPLGEFLFDKKLLNGEL